jgi:hypothetical protein
VAATQTSPGLGVEFRDIEKRYGALLALRRVSLSVNAGEFVALLGANGSGKTTLLKIVAQLARPTAGKVSYSPESADRSASLRARLGMVGHNTMSLPPTKILRFSRDSTNWTTFQRAWSVRLRTPDSLHAPQASFAHFPVGCASGWRLREHCSPRQACSFLMSPQQALIGRGLIGLMPRSPASSGKAARF